MYGVRPGYLAAESSRMANRSSLSTDYSETASFVSTAPSNASSVSVVGDFSVLCLHDYEPTDDDQLGFRKGDILSILKVEDTGWWAAAMGNTIGWVPSGYVEAISDSMADTLRSVHRERRDSSEWDSNSRSGLGSEAISPRGSTDGTPMRDGPWTQRRGSAASHRTFSSDDHSRGIAFANPSRPFAVVSNGTGGYNKSYGDPRLSGQFPTPPVGSPDLRSTPTSVEFILPNSPADRYGPGSNRRLSKDDDALAYRNARNAAAALALYLQPDYGEGYLRLDSDGQVKSGTLEALVERLTVDPLRKSQENIYRMTFLMTYRSFTDASTVFAKLTARYVMEPPPGLTESQLEEWKDKKLRPAQSRVLTTLTEWVERYRLVKDESQLVPNLKHFLSIITEPAKNALTAKHILQSIEKHETLASSASSHSSTSSIPSPPMPVQPKRLKIPPLGGSSLSKSKPHKNELLKIDSLELAQHLTLVEYRLYAKIRPSECMMWPKIQKGPDVENLLRFCGTSDKLVAWVKYSILKEDGLGKRADVIDYWTKVAEKCQTLNNVSSLSAIIAGLASNVIVKLSLTWAHVARGSSFERMLRLTDPSNNFSAYRNLYKNVTSSCVPFVGMYLTQLVHIADQFKETVLVPLHHSPSSSSAALGVPSSPASVSSMPSSSNDSGRTQGSNAPSQAITHINFSRLFRCAEVIHDMLRHQSKGYRQANASANATHLVPDPSQAPGISLGVENQLVMAYVESMLCTGGIGLNAAPELPRVAMGDGMTVGVAEAWYWQRSSELQKTEAETSDIRKGLEAAGF